MENKKRKILEEIKELMEEIRQKRIEKKRSRLTTTRCKLEEDVMCLYSAIERIDDLLETERNVIVVIMLLRSRSVLGSKMAKIDLKQAKIQKALAKLETIL